MKTVMKLCCLPLLAAVAVWLVPTFADIQDLPTRESPRPVTTKGIPHIQIDIEVVPELSSELLERVSAIPGIKLNRTIVGRAGSTGFWLDDDIAPIRPESIIRGREFAHSHPDGSLHASLPPDLATRAIDAGWAIHHPWASSKRGMEGFVMIYTPTTQKELEVVFELVKESYRYVAGGEV